MGTVNEITSLMLKICYKIKCDGDLEIFIFSYKL